MDRIRIAGGKRLKGEIPISGAKNAALPLMAACLLTEAPLTLTNVPNLADVAFMAELLRVLGVRVDWTQSTGMGQGGTLRLHAGADGWKRSRRTTWCAKCARAFWCWDRFWRAHATRRFRCPAVAPSARARSIFI